MAGAVREARCHCGQAVAVCRGEPAKVSLCHCRDCQRRTGSAFSIAAFYPRPAVALPKVGTARFTRPSASGFPVTFHFCSACGTNLWWEPARMPHLVGVAVGAFADSAFPPPEQAVWDEDRHLWLDLAAIPAHRRLPNPGPGDTR